MRKISIVLSSIFLFLSLAITTKIVLASEESSVIINGQLVPLEESSSTSSSSQSSGDSLISSTVEEVTMRTGTSDLPNLGDQSNNWLFIIVGLSLMYCSILTYRYKKIEVC